MWIFVISAKVELTAWQSTQEVAGNTLELCQFVRAATDSVAGCSDGRLAASRWLQTAAVL